MSEQTGPNVATTLFVIHQVVTGALEVTIDNGQTFAQLGFPDRAHREGYLNYLRALVSVLHAHHLVEDELVFDDFRDLFPDTPFNLLRDQHQEMVPLLDLVGSTLELAQDSPSRDSIERIVQALQAINQKWHAHIPIEETHFAPDRLADLLPVEEHLRLIKRYGEHSQQHAGPPFLTIPFILFNLPPETRSIVAAGMPSEVVEHLVPVVWKEKWQSMTPFLLV